MFEALKREKPLSDRVAEQIEALIVTSYLKPGDMLPPQRGLAEQLGVSRTVVREAIKALQARGLVEVRPGNGVRITAMKPEQVSESISLFLQFESNKVVYRHVAELRNMLEIHIAGIAAQRADAEDLERMEAAIHRMEALKEDIGEREENREEFARADVDFHLALATATGNPLLPVLFGPLIDVFLKQRLESIDRPGALEQGITYHRHIFEAIKRGDVEGAREVMRQHLEQSARIMGLKEGETGTHLDL